MKRLNMKRIFAFAVVLMILAAFTSGCSKRYVGQTVNYDWDGWCRYNRGEKHCTVSSGALVFDFDIFNGVNEGQYIVEGNIDPTQGELKSWATMVDVGTRFSLIIANDGVVVDNIGFRPKSYGGRLGNKIPFTINLTRPEGFDAVAFYWRMTVSG